LDFSNSAEEAAAYRAAIDASGLPVVFNTHGMQDPSGKAFPSGPTADMYRVSYDMCVRQPAAPCIARSAG
jgi:hypothetical protein